MSLQDERLSVLEEETIVDVDVHIQMTSGNEGEELLPYLDEPHRSRMKHSLTGKSMNDGWDRSVKGKIDMDYESSKSPDAIYERICEEFHIDYPIINTFGAMTRKPEADWALALMRAHNDFLVEQILDEYDNFKGVANLTTHRPDLVAEEIDRMANEKDIVGLFMYNTGQKPALPLGDPYYDQIWEAAEDNGLNVLCHGSASGAMYEFPRQNQGLNSFMAIHTLSHVWSQMITLTSFINEGVPEKFPDLKFAFLEAGLAWMPYLLWRLNKEYRMRRSESPLLQKLPEEYQDHFYVNTQPLEEPLNDENLSKVIEMIGTDRVMFATDYPHWDFDHPSALDKHLRMHFDEDQRKQILHGNAAEFFDLNI
ncbi:MAG: amidohydrolase family protein [Salinigranum sp.]